MLKTLTLKQAIAQAFDIDGRTIPEFTSSKPVQEARNWLDRQGVKYDYVRGAKQNGVFIFTRGAGSPQFAVIDDDTEQTAGLLALATLAPKKYHSKSEQRRVEASQAAKVQGDDVESAPTITNSPEDQADTEMTVTEPTPKRTTRRKK